MVGGSCQFGTQWASWLGLWAWQRYFLLKEHILLAFMICYAIKDAAFKSPFRTRMSELEIACQRLAQQDAELTELRQENEVLRAELAKTKAELTVTRYQLRMLANHVFGKKSEKTPPEWAQGFLLENEGDEASPEAAPAKETKPRGGSKKGRKVRAALLPDDLPVEEVILVPDEVRLAPEAYRHFGDDVVERIEITPRRVFKQRLIRRNYSLIAQPFAAPITAPLPMDVLPGSFLGPKLVIELALGKYLYHLPLYRQAQALKYENGIILPLATLCDTMGRLAEALEPIYKIMMRQLWASQYVQIDLTPVRCLSGEREGGSFLGQMWVTAEVGGDVIYNWDQSKAALVAERLIPAGFTGLLQCDGGSEIACYLEGGLKRHQSPDPLAPPEPPPKVRIKRLGCWAHVRRKYFQAAKAGNKLAQWILKRINLLYRIERIAREAGMDAPTRQALRQKRSRRVLQRIKAKIEQAQHTGLLLPSSPVMKAIHYNLNQWESLEHYLDHGHAEIDNNGVENAIRPSAVGKKNWLFIGNVAAGQRSAILYSIIGSCLRRGLSPRDYLHWLFERLPNATTENLLELPPAACAAMLVKQKQEDCAGNPCPATQAKVA